MAQGKVSVAAHQTGSGATKQVERSVLFIGQAPDNNGKILPINAQSDFDVEFGAADSPLKTQVKAWQRNGDDLSQRLRHFTRTVQLKCYGAN